MRGLVHQREEEGGTSIGSDGLRVGGVPPPKKRQKNQEVKDIDNLLLEFAAGINNNKDEIQVIERKQDKKHEDLMQGMLGLTEENREQSERRSHNAYLEREARMDELVLILEELRKDNEI
ncbi:hypothetical protein HOY82DRAFT_543777 [Tuber indicum]|nr:hypothetical protein HOY82DRAFT_543777 [Tuber indicum]